MYQNTEDLPCISLITVCRNSAATIEKTLDSVASQSYPWVEYIVVDGASTDDTLLRLQPYKAHIDHIISEPDKGIYDAMNKGIARATGQVVGFLNADDTFEDTQVLETIAQVFADPHIQACYGDLVYVNKENNITRYWQSSPVKRGAFTRGWSPPHPTFYMRTSCYKQYGSFDLRYPIGNDIELMMRFLEKHQVRAEYIPKVLVRMLTGGVSNRSWKNIIHQNKIIMQAAQAHGLPIRWWQYLSSKTLNRLGQRLKRPKGVLS